MATAEFRGYVNRPESKESAKGGFSKWTLGVTQKNKGRNGEPDTKYQYYVDCVNFKSPVAPKDGAFVTVSGYLDIREYESKSGKNAGKTMQGLNLNVQELSVAEPREAQAAGGTPALQADPFANPADDGIPF